MLLTCLCCCPLSRLFPRHLVRWTILPVTLYFRGACLWNRGGVRRKHHEYPAQIRVCLLFLSPVALLEKYTIGQLVVWVSSPETPIVPKELSRTSTKTHGVPTYLPTYIPTTRLSYLPAYHTVPHLALLIILLALREFCFINTNFPNARLILILPYRHLALPKFYNR